MSDTQTNENLQLFEAIFHAIRGVKCLADRHSPCKAIIAFSREHKYQGPLIISAGMNGFHDSKIPKMLRTAPYRLLIVVDMFQTRLIDGQKGVNL